MSEQNRRITISGKTYDEERALYNLKHADLSNCTFAGPADGESALKESRDVNLENCSFSLRYPLWHTNRFTMKKVKMDELTRAAIWYAKKGEIEDCDLCGVKAVRECKDIIIRDSRIVSTEFGWKSSGISLDGVKITSEYIFLDSRNISLSNVEMKGKYSFQYVQNMTIDDSFLDTKDAFWHSKNVTVRNSTVKGEYLAWFSESLTLINCKIIGTQPLCYCKNLKLVNCTMEEADFAFEYSEVDADVSGHIVSIKNPLSGTIVCDSVGEIIKEKAVRKCTGKVTVR